MRDMRLTSLLFNAVAVTTLMLAACVEPWGPAELVPGRQGESPTEVHARFAEIIEQNIREADRDIVAMLSDKELSDLVAAYRHETGGKANPLIALLGSQASSASVDRVADLVSRAAAAPEPTTNSGPTLDMTLQEIYLEFRTAPVGALSVRAALAETAMFAGSRVAIAYTAGYEVGTGIRWLLVNYAPAVDNAIGAGVARAVDAVRNAVNSTSLGSREYNLDNIMDAPIYRSSNYYGDFGVSSAMGTFVDSGGACAFAPDPESSLTIPKRCEV
jgi:hypothetical protein